MYAVIETGGKQFTVKEGDVLKIDRLDLTTDKEVIFDKVLFFKAGQDFKVGTPYIEGIKVRAEVIDIVKDKKILVYRPPSKKAIRKLRGHRQWYAKIRIKEILGG